MFDDRIAAANSKLSRMKMFDNEEKKESCGSDPAGTECKYGGEYGEARQDLFGFEGKDCCDSDEEMIVCGQGGSDEDNEFDAIVGALEGIIIDAEFSELQNNFCREYCDIFVEDDENKIEYTKVFNRYTRTIESYIEERLQQVMPEFQMDRFARMCHKRKSEITGDVFDILLSCGDFHEFKFLMLSHKNSLHSRSPLMLSGAAEFN